MYSRANIPRSMPSIIVSSMSNQTSVDQIEKTFESLGKILKIEQKVCGKHKKQAIVHFKFWYENKDSDSARSVLLRSEELLVMHKLNKYWSTFSMDPLDDDRPYSVRRLDDRLCEYDVSQGFKDRRIQKQKQENSIDPIVDLMQNLSINNNLPIAKGLEPIAKCLELDNPSNYEYNRHTPETIEEAKNEESYYKDDIPNYFTGDGRINGNLNYGPYVQPPKKRKLQSIYNTSTSTFTFTK